MTTLSEIKDLAAKQFGGEPSAIDEAVPVDRLGIDSLGFLEFLFELEDHFDISIPQERVVHVRTLRDLAAEIDSLVAMKKAAAT
jgi:acyl carrier protein